MNRIEAYAGERIAYTSEVIDGTYATVRSKIITQRRSEIRINYRMHLHDGRWQVYDVLIDGVSFVSTYRSQFDRVIQAESYGALIERLRKRNLDTAGVEEEGGSVAPPASSGLLTTAQLIHPRRCGASFED